MILLPQDGRTWHVIKPHFYTGRSRSKGHTRDNERESAEPDEAEAASSSTDRSSSRGSRGAFSRCGSERRRYAWNWRPVAQPRPGWSMPKRIRSKRGRDGYASRTPAHALTWIAQRAPAYPVHPVRISFAALDLVPGWQARCGDLATPLNWSSKKFSLGLGEVAVGLIFKPLARRHEVGFRNNFSLSITFWVIDKDDDKEKLLVYFDTLD